MYLIKYVFNLFADLAYCLSTTKMYYSPVAKQNDLWINNFIFGNN